ncbi:hypothetical protein D3C72_1948830 [compost metagenome]
MGELGENDLVEGLGRGADGRHDRGMPVPVGDDPPGGNTVEQAIAVLIDEKCAFR